MEIFKGLGDVLYAFLCGGVVGGMGCCYLGGLAKGIGLLINSYQAAQSGQKRIGWVKLLGCWGVVIQGTGQGDWPGNGLVSGRSKRPDT